MDILAQISRRAPLKLKGLSFQELFAGLSSSLEASSRSNPAMPFHSRIPRIAERRAVAGLTDGTWTGGAACGDFHCKEGSRTPTLAMPLHRQRHLHQ